MSYELDPERVRTIFSECLIKNLEEPDQVRTEGITIDVPFNSHRLGAHAIEIAAMLEELPPQFREEGGGWSFLEACRDKRGRHWGEHTDMERLVLLGLGLGLVVWLLPRECWSALPGGMPYFAVKLP